MIIHPGRARLGINLKDSTGAKYALGNFVSGSNLLIPVKQGAYYGLSVASLAISAVAMLAF